MPRFFFRLFVALIFFFFHDSCDNRGAKSTFYPTAVAAAAATCQNRYAMSFKPTGDPGDSSYITPQSTQVVLLPFRNLPTVVVRFTFLSGAPDLALDGITAQAVTQPLLRLGGDSVELMQGQAIFRALQVQQAGTAGTTYRFVFSITVPYGNVTQTYQLTSPPIQFLTAEPPADRNVTLQFGNMGYFFRPLQIGNVPVGIAIPRFSLRFLNALGYNSPSTVATVAVTFGNYPPGVITVTPSVIAVTGSVDVTNLVVRGPLRLGGALTFVATVAGTNVTSTLRTGSLNLTDPGASAACEDIMFDPTKSFFRYENTGGTAVLDVVMPPVVIQCVTAALKVDTAASGTVVRAIASGAQLSGDAALIMNGYATFANLQFVGFAPKSAVITFTANFRTSSSSFVQQLVSGAVTVSSSPIKARHLTFGSDSSMQEGDATVDFLFDAAALTVSIPAIVVTVKDSSLQVDSTANGIQLVIQLVAESGEPLSLLGSSVMEVYQGVAKAFDVRFTGATVGTKFFIRLVDAAGIRPSLVSSPGRVVAAVTTPTVASERLRSSCLNSNTTTTACSFSIAFAPSPYSAIPQADAPLTATVGVSIPEVRVYLFDEVDVRVTEAASTPGSILYPTPSNGLPRLRLYAHTDEAAGPDGETLLQTDGGRNVGVWKGRYLSFSCLQFASFPTRLVRIYFKLYFLDVSTNTLLRTAIPSIRSGFLAVTADTRLAYNVQFTPSSEHSLFQFANQAGASAVVNVALPQIQLQLLDSIGGLDTTTTDVSLVVSSSSASVTTDGPVPFLQGIATIPNLRFLMKADSPTLSFTIQSNPHRVSDLVLSTGELTLSQFPIDSFQLQIVNPSGRCPTGDGTVCVTSSPFAATFPNFAAVKLQTILRVTDSTYQPQDSETVGSSTEVTVSQSSSEALLGLDSSFDTRLAVDNQGGVALTTTLVGLRDAYVGVGDVPIYITFTVTSAPTAPNLLGKRVLIGPLTITSLSSASSSSSSSSALVCSSAVSAPIVGIKLYHSLAALSNNLPQVLANISALLGVETARVIVVGDLRAAGGFRPDNTKWVGSRFAIQFTDPTSNSAKRASSASLAASLVGIRPDCAAQHLQIADVFYLSAERGCDTTAYFTAVARAKQCSIEGFYSRCQCYVDQVINVMGVVCSSEISISSQFEDMCTELSDCPQSEVSNVCASFLSSQEGKYAWAFAVVGSLLGVGLISWVVVGRIQRHYGGFRMFARQVFS